MNTRVRFPLAAAAVALLLGAGTASGPTGFAENMLGKSVDEVRKALPTLEKLGEDEKLAGVVIKGPAISRYGTRKLQVPGLAKPTDVEWRFWNGKLWVVIVLLGENDADEVVAAIRKERGTDPGQADTQKNWYGEKSMIAVSAKWYTIGDDALTKEAQAWFVSLFGRKVGGDRGPAAPHEEPRSDVKIMPGAPAGEAPEKVELLKGETGATPGAPVGEAPEKVQLLKTEGEATPGAHVPLVPGSAPADD